MSVGLVASVNVGLPRLVEVDGRTVRTAIWKNPVEGRVPLRGVNLQGDDQADRTVHGGPDKAVYAYGFEDTRWWAHELDTELPAGAFGENLTVSGLPVSEAVIGERWEVGAHCSRSLNPGCPASSSGSASVTPASSGGSPGPAVPAHISASSARVTSGPATRSPSRSAPNTA